MRARDIVRALTAFALAGALAVSGCGDSSRPLAPIERAELHAFVDRARAAARANDLPATNAALEGLKARVRELRGAGRLDRETADRLLKYSAVTQLRARTTLQSASPAVGEAEGEGEAEAPAAPVAPAAGGDGDDGGDGAGDDKDDEKAKDDDKAKDDGKAKGNAKGRD